MCNLFGDCIIKLLNYYLDQDKRCSMVMQYLLPFDPYEMYESMVKYEK